MLQFPVAGIDGWESMLHVPTLPFLDTSLLERLGLGGAFDPHALEYARALGIGCQWFGKAVGWKGYRDRWLIDGLAGYAGVLYLDRRYPDTARDRPVLAGLRDLLLAPAGVDPSGKAMIHDDIGPVWLGQRLTSTRTPNAYVNTVYTKSVWIVHMECESR